MTAPRTVVIAGGNQAVVQPFTLDAQGKVVEVGYRYSAHAGFQGPFRVASADMNRDGVQDVIVSSSPGMPDDVRVFNGSVQASSPTNIIKPFGGDFYGGVYVATGDFTGDGVPEIAVSPDQGGGPRVIIYDVANGSPRKIADFYGIQDANFRGGARLAIGDVTGDGVPDLIVAAGFGGGPRVTIWDGNNVNNANGTQPTGNPIANFFAFEPTLRNGTFVSTADMNGDGVADLVFGAGPGGGPRVLVVDPNSLFRLGASSAVGNPLANFFAGDANERGGVRVKALPGNAKEKALIVTGSGESSDWRVFAASPGGNFTMTEDRDAFGTANLDGVYVG